MKEAELDYLWERRDALLHRAELSTRYHRKRERFFALLDKWDKIFTLLFGSAAFVQIISFDKYPLLAFPFVTFAIASLVFDFSENTRKHSDLASHFKMLESAIEAVGQRDFTETDLNTWSARICEIESGEPAIYNLLVRICQNEIARAKGKKADVTAIPFWRAGLANFIPFANDEIKPRHPV